MPAPIDKLLAAEVEYLLASGWRRDRGDTWIPPRPNPKNRVYRQGHAVNAQKQLDFSLFRKPTMENAPTVEETKAVETPVVKPRKPRGFAAMDPKRVSELAARGGKAAHAAGTAHRFSQEEARAAGRKGGLASGSRRSSTPASNPTT